MPKEKLNESIPTIVAFLCLTIVDDGKTMVLQAQRTHKNWRRLGLGAYLENFALKWSQENTEVLKVRLTSRDSLAKNHERHGWKYLQNFSIVAYPTCRFQKVELCHLETLTSFREEEANKPEFEVLIDTLDNFFAGEREEVAPFLNLDWVPLQWKKDKLFFSEMKSILHAKAIKYFLSSPATLPDTANTNKERSAASSSLPSVSIGMASPRKNGENMWCVSIYLPDNECDEEDLKGLLRDHMLAHVQEAISFSSNVVYLSFSRLPPSFFS